jgi:hypothetical protein
VNDRKVFRYEVPVDGNAHVFALTGDPVAVAAVGDNGVEFWAEHDWRKEPGLSRAFRVFGTGQPLPEDVTWAGTCQRSPGGLVWHLYEVTP